MKKRDQVETDLAKEKSARVAAKKRAEVIEQKLKAFEDNFPTLKEECINEGINSCTDEVV